MANDGGGNGGSDDLSSSLATVKGKVKSFIKSGVASTNGALEETERLVYRPALQSAQTAQKESAAFLRQASSVYDKRQEYGPYIVTASAMVVGTAVGIARRRGAGRLPATILSGLLAGGAAYVGVYQVDLYRIPDMIFRRNQ